MSSVDPEPGVFIAFEGGDGAGKTTQIERLHGWLSQQGREVVVTREPGGTPVGQQIRQLVLHGDDLAPRAEALLFAADRAHHVATVVRPALARGAVVLQDRYLDSSVAYQGAGRDLDADEVQRLSLWATQDLRPDLTVLLDVSPETGRARRGDVHDRLESESDDFHDRVRRHFLSLAEAEAHRYLVVDAALPVDEIAAIVQERVAEIVGVA
ncbi:dTMP kinase [Luteipulveratus halotolerans]|uniref:Thymidylate kinase n=1 Tax=Luteipulveratus halotolerans TaxID=1631356 RepID=A0A0L6CEZ0_9MICO|nr:dTMP kinase [Luteipulveratus halotolerans]KNX36140.1 thymidylate kinase [Luteipulveratus halotolerans]